MTRPERVVEIAKIDFGTLTLLSNIPFQDRLVIDWERDTLLFIGDYVDRGHQPFEVVERLVDLKRQHPATIFLRGNHEDMLLNYLAGRDRLTYLANGGQRTLDAYLKRRREMDLELVPKAHFDFFKSTLLYYQTDEYIFVHAGMRPKVPLEKQLTEDLLWIRGDFIRSSYDFGRRVVFGHTPFSEPFEAFNKIGIDTGAVYGNKLTCVELPGMVFHQV